MHQFFLNHTIDPNEPIILERSDYQHLFVLRLRVGESFILSDGNNTEYLCHVTEVEKNQMVAVCDDTRTSENELPCQITLLQGLPKSDKLELIVQKATELGAQEIVPVSMARSVVKLDDKKREAKKISRLQEIAKSAAEQSKRGIIPAVRNAASFKEALASTADADIRLICFEDETSRKNLSELLPSLPDAKKIVILVGPEGGISEEEWQLATQAGFQSVSLGKRILRTETAGFCLLSYLMLHLENA